MKTRRFIHPATVFFLLTLLVVCVSWVGSIFAWEQVQNLLSAEGLRWMLRYAGDCFTRSSLVGAVLLLFLGGGLWVNAGLLESCRQYWQHERKLSRKERRGLFLSWTTGGVYLLLWLFLAFGPLNVVRSVTGTLADSPLSDGICYVVSLGLGLMGAVYGFVTDFYRNDADVVRGMSGLFRILPEYFVTLFFVIQFFAVFQHSGLYLFLALPASIWKGIYYVCCLFPLWYGRPHRTL